LKGKGVIYILTGKQFGAAGILTKLQTVKMLVPLYTFVNVERKGLP
jgi:hypothetical protein